MWRHRRVRHRVEGAAVKLWLASHFGRVTLERTKAALIAEAHELVTKHSVMALQFSESAARSLLDAQHHDELAAHYDAAITRLSTPEPKDF
jgi:hypothetical protein